MAEPRTIKSPYDARTGHNGTGSDIAKSVCVQLKAAPTYDHEVELCATATGNPYGITSEIIADTEKGGVQIRNRAVAIAGATIAVGARVMPDTGGKLITATAGNTVVGTAATAGVTDEEFEVELIGPGGAEMPG